MKSILSVISLSVCLLLVACQTEQKDETKDLGALVISDGTPSAGEELQVSYQAEKEADVDADFYYLVGTNVYAQDMDLKDSDTVYKGTVMVPDSATAIAFHFSNDEVLDTNGKKGYALPVYDQEGNPVAGAKASQSYYYWRIGNRQGLEIDEATIVAEMKKDMEAHADIQSTWDQAYVQLLYGQNQDSANAYVQERIEAYSAKENLTKENYSTLAFFYNVLRDKSKTDSIHKVIAQKFPEGQMAQRAYFVEFNKAADLAAKEALLKKYDAKFTGEQIFKDRMGYVLANAYIKKGNKEKFEELANSIENNQVKASLYNSAAWAKVEKEEDLEWASAISKKSLEAIDAEKKSMTEKPSQVTADQYEDRLDARYAMFADTYALIAFKQGNLEKAIKYQEIAADEGTDGKMNESYLKYLDAAKKYGEVEELATEYIQENAATKKAKDYFKTAYVANHGSDEGFDAKLAELEKIGHANALAKIKKEMLHEPAPTFTLADLKGNNISLASLKGKTVILDFWATWCGPCKASFPGMQKAVEKYKDNDKVAFFFVNTFETAPSLDQRVEKVGGFITGKAYDFHVLLDKAPEGSRDFEVATAYGITGIPTKIIIGPKGNITFKKVGYGGNNDKMLQEIEMMIELSQKG